MHRKRMKPKCDLGRCRPTNLGCLLGSNQRLVEVALELITIGFLTPISNLPFGGFKRGCVVCGTAFLHRLLRRTLTTKPEDSSLFTSGKPHSQSVNCEH